MRNEQCGWTSDKGHVLPLMSKRQLAPIQEGTRDEFHLAATAQNFRKLAKLLTTPVTKPA